MNSIFIRIPEMDVVISVWHRKNPRLKKLVIAGCWWLMPVILNTQEQRSG
jgi:hypothetical protein